MLIGQALRSRTRFTGTKGTQLSTVPPGSAAATPAPGPTATMHCLPAAAAAPTAPSEESKFVALAAADQSAQPGTGTDPSTPGAAASAGGSGRVAQGFWGAGASRTAAARPPAERPSQPSIGQVLV